MVARLIYDADEQRSPAPPSLIFMRLNDARQVATDVDANCTQLSSDPP